MSEDLIIFSKGFQDTLESVRTCKAYLEASDGDSIGFAHFTKDFYYFFEMVKGNEENINIQIKQELKQLPESRVIL